MEIKNIDEARKYFGKTIYTSDDPKERGKFKAIPLTIQGVNLFYTGENNPVEVEGFALWDRSGFWGDIKLDRIHTDFNEGDLQHGMYYFSLSGAKKYSEWLSKDEKERQREYDIATARELLDKHSVSYEVFG